MEFFLMVNKLVDLLPCLKNFGFSGVLDMITSNGNFDTFNTLYILYISSGHHQVNSKE